jgi:hypothetical protein
MSIYAVWLVNDTSPSIYVVAGLTFGILATFLTFGAVGFLATIFALAPHF